MKWLITGGCGFIGTRVIERLRAEDGHAIRVLDNLSVGSKSDLSNVSDVSSATVEAVPKIGGPVQLVEGDIGDAETATAAARSMDVVLHLAANTGVIPSLEDPKSDCRTNVLGTLNMLEAAREAQVGSLVFASSGAPLGEQEPPIHENKVPRPVSPYGASKLAGEAYCNVYTASFGLRTVALRFGNVYGPGSTHKGSVVAKFIKQAMEGQTLVVYGDGKQTRDFIFTDDLVDALYRAGTRPDARGLYQIASGGETTVNEIVTIMKRILAERGIDIAVEHQASRAGEVIRNYSDITRARTELGWEPKHDLEDGLRKTISWYLEGR